MDNQFVLVSMQRRIVYCIKKYANTPRHILERNMMRLNCHDIEMLIVASEEKGERGDELAWRDYNRLVSKLRTYADQLLECDFDL